MDDVSSRFGVDSDYLLFEFDEQKFHEYDSANDLGIKPDDTVNVFYVG